MYVGIKRLESTDFWGVNPELLQHEQMTGLTGVAAAAMAVSFGKMFFLHIGNQKPNQFDNDNPVLVGIDGLKEFISVLYVLEKMGWKGHVEFDNHILRTDTAPGEGNRTAIRREFIELNVDAYRTAESRAIKLAEDNQINSIQDKLWNSHNGIAEILKGGDLDKIGGATVDYNSVNEEALKLGSLDMLVNKKIMGM